MRKLALVVSFVFLGITVPVAAYMNVYAINYHLYEKRGGGERDVEQEVPSVLFNMDGEQRPLLAYAGRKPALVVVAGGLG